MTSTQPSSYLLALPDELIIHIASNFDTIRSKAPQSQAFKDKSKERSRQRDNHDRRVALYALCLTNRRLNGICTPTLYSSLISSTTLRGFRLLQLFFETLNVRKELGSRIRYVENRLSDYLGNNLVHDMDHHRAEDMLPNYYAQLATIIRSSPNIEQICVISIESFDLSLWKLLLNNISEFKSTIAYMAPKLKVLALQTNTRDCYAMTTDGISFTRFASVLGFQPMLSELSVSGVVSGTRVPVVERFRKLRRINILESAVRLSDLDMLLHACNLLEHLSCHWALLPLNYCDMGDDSFTGLLDHEKTLESLCITMSRLQPFGSDPEGFKPRNLRQFTALRDVKLCNFFIPAKHFVHPEIHPPPPTSLAIHLPPSLERLTIFHTYHPFERDPGAQLSSCCLLTALWDLTKDCQRLLPKLRDLVVQSSVSVNGGALSNRMTFTSSRIGNVLELKETFRALGVQFTLIGDLESTS